MKKNTEKSSAQLRGLATIVMALGCAVAIVLVICSFAYGKWDEYVYQGDGIIAAIAESGIMYWVEAVAVFFAHYVAYVMISAYATLVENSDRSDVVEALRSINATLSFMPANSAKRNEEAIKKAVEAVAEKEEEK